MISWIALFDRLDFNRKCTILKPLDPSRIGLSELRRELTHTHTAFALLADTPLYVSIFIRIMKLRGLIVFLQKERTFEIVLFVFKVEQPHM